MNTTTPPSPTVFVWPDGFWCYSDHYPSTKRPEGYNVVHLPDDIDSDGAITEYLAFMNDTPLVREHDPVDHPKHYTSHPSGIEPIEITRYEDFLTGNVIKYVMRHRYKNRPVEDLKKARFYLDERIRVLEEGATWDVDGKPEVLNAAT